MIDISSERYCTESVMWKRDAYEGFYMKVVVLGASTIPEVLSEVRVCSGCFHASSSSFYDLVIPSLLYKFMTRCRFPIF